MVVLLTHFALIVCELHLSLSPDKIFLGEYEVEYYHLRLPYAALAAARAATSAAEGVIEEDYDGEDDAEDVQGNT